MLVLAVREQGSIYIGSTVVKVLGIRDGRVRLGIEADQAIDVYRQEVYDEIQRDKENVIPSVSLSP